MNKAQLKALGALAIAMAFIPRLQAAEPVPYDTTMGMATLPLWDGLVPGSAADSGDGPALTVFAPHPGRGNGTSIIIAPGGAYLGLANNLEGRQVADWFASRGVTAFVLKYRLGASNPYPIPLLDAQRAIRVVRSLDRRYGIASNRVGIMGFSAGGHLAAAAGTLFDSGAADSADPIDRLSDRPDFVVLGYPWLNAMQPNDRHLITYCGLLPQIPAAKCRSYEQPYTPKLHVTAQTPSVFIFSTTDDETVPASASVEFYAALIAAGVPAELHLFRHGAHGSGLGSGDATLDVWPELLEHWLRDQGLLTPELPASAK